MEEKYRLQNLIAMTASREGTAVVTEPVMREAFPEPSEMRSLMEMLAFNRDGKRPPPQARSEQIERFCQVNGLEYKVTPADDGDLHEFTGQTDPSVPAEYPTLYHCDCGGTTAYVWMGVELETIITCWHCGKEISVSRR